LLVDQIGVKEAVIREIHSVTSLEQMEEDPVESQIGKLVEAIQQQHQRVVELEL